MSSQENNDLASPTTLSSTTQSSGNRKRKSRGGTMAKEIWDRTEPIYVEYNEFGQVCCQQAKNVSTFLGTLARKSNILPLDVLDWTLQDPSNLDVAWEEVKKRFTVDHPKCKETQMKNLSSRWRYWKTYVKDHFFVEGDRGASMKKFEESNESRVDTSQYAALVEYWMKPEVQETSKRNSNNAKMQTLPHSQGRTSISRLSQIMENETGKKPDRVDIWIQSRTRKDGTILSPCQAKVDEIKKLKFAQNQCEPPLEETQDILNQAGLKDRHGRLRAMGPGVTRTSYYGLTKRIRADESEELMKLRALAESNEEERTEFRAYKTSQEEKMVEQQKQLLEQKNQLAMQQEQILVLMRLVGSRSSTS